MIKIVMLDDDIDSCHIVNDILLDHPAIYLQAYATNEYNFKVLVKKHQPDIALVDIDLETPKQGLTILSWLKFHHPLVKPIMLTVDQDSVKNCYTNGAKAYIIKSRQISLANTIKRVFAGDVVVPNNTARILISQISEDEKKSKLKEELSLFTQREVEILSHINAERAIPQATQKMGISRYTYKRHLQNIRSKSGVFNLTELVSKFKGLL